MIRNPTTVFRILCGIIAVSLAVAAAGSILFLLFGEFLAGFPTDAF